MVFETYGFFLFYGSSVSHVCGELKIDGYHDHILRKQQNLFLPLNFMVLSIFELSQSVL